MSKRTFKGLHENEYDVDPLSDPSNVSNHVRVTKKDGKTFFVPLHDWLALANIIVTAQAHRQACVKLEEVRDVNVER